MEKPCSRSKQKVRCHISCFLIWIGDIIGLSTHEVLKNRLNTSDEVVSCSGHILDNIKIPQTIGFEGEKNTCGGTMCSPVLYLAGLAEWRHIVSVETEMTGTTVPVPSLACL